MVATCCVLYINMGLHEAIVKTTGIDLRITGCPKCLVFWSVLIWSIPHGHGIVESIFASFSLSYCALWASMILDALSIAYNRIYESITQNTGTKEASAPEADNPEVPQM